MEEKRDYSLLRPFDLEAAKRGEAVIDIDGDIVTYIGGPSEKGEFCVDIGPLGFGLCEANELRMAPLAWVEGKPVYKGSRLFHDCGPCVVVGLARLGDHDLRIKVDRLSVESDAKICLLTWAPPKVKREGWVNVYPPVDLSFANAALSDSFRSKEEADAAAKPLRIACIHIKWEEKATI